MLNPESSDLVLKNLFLLLSHEKSSPILFEAHLEKATGFERIWRPKAAFAEVVNRERQKENFQMGHLQK
jgi:hypothetical protein